MTKRTTYTDIVKAFEKQECQLLTTEEEFLNMIEEKRRLNKPANTGWFKFKFIAQCKHNNEVFFNDFTRRQTGVLCKQCSYAKMAREKQQEAKLSSIVGNSYLVEYEGYKICKELLKNDFEIYRTNNCCLADFIIKPICVLDDKYLGVQLKVCSKSIRGTYAFHQMNKGYDDLLIVCICLAENKIWAFDYNDIKNKKILSIGRSKIEYNKFLQSPEKFRKCCQDFYDHKPNFTKDELMTPITEKYKVEHEYRVRREKELDFIPFKNLEVDNAVIDFLINGTKHQEKVASHHKRNNGTYTVSICKWNPQHKKITSYDKGDNDFYWIWLKDSTMFYIFPESILIEKEKIGIPARTGLSFNVNYEDWKKDYLFDFQDLNKDKIISLLGINEKYNDEDTTIFIPQMIIPEPEPMIVREKKQSFCIDCKKEISLGSTRCVDCNAKNNRIVERPPKEVLLKMIADTSYVQVGRHFGVSDICIRKWLKHY